MFRPKDSNIIASYFRVVIWKTRPAIDLSSSVGKAAPYGMIESTIGFHGSRWHRPTREKSIAKSFPSWFRRCFSVIDFAVPLMLGVFPSILEHQE